LPHVITYAQSVSSSTWWRFGGIPIWKWIGEPVLLIHGVTSSNRAFQLFADALIARGKAPFAVDLRGRGDSNSLPGPFGMKQHAEDMAAVIDHFGWSNPDVIGHSMGAFVAAAVAGLYANKVGEVVFADGGVPLPCHLE
jgi:lipase